VLGRALKKLTKPSGDVKVRFFTVCPTNDVMSLDPYWTINFTICKLLFSYIFTASNQSQDDHSLDNVKFPDNSMTFPWQFVTLQPMLTVTHITSVLVLLSLVRVGMQQCTIKNQTEMLKFSKVKNGRKYAANNKQF